MNTFTLFEQRIRAILEELRAEGTLPQDCPLNTFVVEPPREAAHGDLATNAAMVLAKPARCNPKELAGVIAARLAREPNVEKAEVAGPGFINLTLKADYWPNILRAILTEGENF
jgi:arginyl-tRNA synthetase